MQPVFTAAIGFASVLYPFPPTSQAFAQTCFVVDDVAKAVSALEAKQVNFVRRPGGDVFPEVAVAEDPTGYRVMLAPRGISSFKDAE